MYYNNDNPIEVRHVYNHVEVYINGEFEFSEDNKEAAYKELIDGGWI